MNEINEISTAAQFDGTLSYSSNFYDVFNEIIRFLNLELIAKVLLIYFFFVWISLVIWVIKDITNRTNSLIFQLICIFIIVVGTPFMIFLYLLIRPSKTLLDKSFEETDFIPEYFNLSSKGIKTEIATICPKCKYDKIFPDFKKCPNCGEELKLYCKGCKKEINSDWKICPYCEEKLKSAEKKEKDEKEVKIEVEKKEESKKEDDSLKE